MSGGGGSYYEERGFVGKLGEGQQGGEGDEEGEEWEGGRTEEGCWQQRR